MPSIDSDLEQELFNCFSYETRNLEKAKSLLKAHPELVNSFKKPPCPEPLIAAVMYENDMELIRLVLTHPNFDPIMNEYNKNKTGAHVESAIKHIIMEANVEALQLVIKNPLYLLDRNQLSYGRAIYKLEIEQACLESRRKKDPNSNSTKESERVVKNLTQMIAMLRNETIAQAKNIPAVRDAAVLFAIERDDVGFLNALEQSGVNTIKPLSNEKLPILLLSVKNKQLLNWYESKYQYQAKNPHGFFNHPLPLPSQNKLLAQDSIENEFSALDLGLAQLSFFNKQQQLLDMHHAQEKREIYERGLKQTNALAQKVIDSLPKEEEQTSSYCAIS